MAQKVSSMCRKTQDKVVVISPATHIVTDTCVSATLWVLFMLKVCNTINHLTANDRVPPVFSGFWYYYKIYLILKNKAECWSRKGGVHGSTGRHLLETRPPGCCGRLWPGRRWTATPPQWSRSSLTELEQRRPEQRQTSASDAEYQNLSNC